MSTPRCGARYGNRRQHTCQLPAGHKGRHAIRTTLRQLLRRQP